MHVTGVAIRNSLGVRCPLEAVVRVVLIASSGQVSVVCANFVNCITDVTAANGAAVIKTAKKRNMILN